MKNAVKKSLFDQSFAQSVALSVIRSSAWTPKVSRYSRCVTTKPNGVASLQNYRSLLKVAVMARSRWNPVEVERRPVLRLSRQVTRTKMEALTCGSVDQQRKVAEQSQL